MRTIIAVAVMLGIIVSPITSSYASDWDKVGKGLAIVEGVRILTGGNVDLIGNITGVNGGGWTQTRTRSWSKPRRNRSRRTYAKTNSYYSKNTWVPHYVWRKKYIPEHEEYDPDYGTIVVEAHYIKYRITDGGHWE